MTNVPLLMKDINNGETGCEFYGNVVLFWNFSVKLNLYSNSKFILKIKKT